MKHDVLTEAAIRHAKQEWEARERLELQRRGQRLEEERQIIHEAQQTLKGINDAIMEYFGKK